MAASPLDSRSSAFLVGPRAPLACYFLLQVVFVPFQIWRLHQETAFGWMAVDLLGQAATLAVLLIFPAGRDALLRGGKLLMPPGDVFRWIVGVVALNVLLGHLLLGALFWLPDYALGAHPAATGWLLAANLTLGLALGAWLEEVVYRRLAVRALGNYLGHGAPLIVASALVFGAIHWWSGLLNIIGVTLAGILFMLFYLRAGTIWPVVLAHYLINLFWLGLY